MHLLNMLKTTEIRHLQPVFIIKLSQMLDQCGWKEVMAIIPSDPLNMSSHPKYSVEEMQLVESHGRKINKSYTEILLQEWGTSGKMRPTIQTLLDVLVKAELFRAADYLAVNILQKEPPQRPTFGPAASISTDIDELLAPAVDNASLHAIQVTAPDDLPHFPYIVLNRITNSFSEIPFDNTVSHTGPAAGNKLGSGAFGAVYYGVMPDGKAVAVKRLMSDTVAFFQQFQTEIIALSNYKHPNLLALLGFSCDTNEYCVVYEFMPNGSLQDRLLKTRSDTDLIWRVRVEIALGLCRALYHLHTARATPLIHRDVKTANILLAADLSPRLGDFGLVKSSPTDSRLTTTVFGTSAYMAPEAFRGDVSVKMDVFSAGVVFLELLTALPPYDENREGADIVTFIEGEVDDSIVPFLDQRAQWDERIANDLFIISQKCLDDKKHRPFIVDVREALESLVENISYA